MRSEILDVRWWSVRKKERKKNKTQYNYFFFVVIAMMEVTNHKRTVVSISSRYVDLTEIFLKNYFHVNWIVNQVNFNVAVQMQQHQVLFAFHDHFNAMVIPIVPIVRMKLDAVCVTI